MSQENVTMVKTAYEAFGRGDIPGVLGLLDGEIDWVFPMGASDTPGTFHGHEAVVQKVFMPIPENWDNFAVIPREFIDNGSYVVVLGNQHGTGKATGQKMELPFVHVVQMRNGKVIRFEEFFDTALYNQALGSLSHR